VVTIRLARHGGKKNPFYHVTVAEKSAKRDGRFIERVGFYNPVARGREETLRIDLERVDYWLSAGAQPTQRVKQLLARSRNAPVQEPTADEIPAAEETQAAEKTEAAAETEAVEETGPVAETAAAAEETPAAEQAAAEEIPAAEAAEQTAADAEPPASEPAADEPPADDPKPDAS